MTRIPSAVRWTARPLLRRIRPSPLERRLASFALRRDDVAIDCGANVGDVTAILARSGAEIHAFEPDPHAFAVLQARVGPRSNVHLHPEAVLDRDETVRLYLHRNAGDDPVRWSVGSSLLRFKGNVDPKRYVEVNAIDLARFVLELDTFVKLVKIDVEGVEHAIIRRLVDSRAIERIGTVLVEVHDAHVPELREATERLRAHLRAEGVADKVQTDWR